ncbi:hypothetical protein ABIE64_003561 [Thalassospira sp. MBR-102]|jgi:hypothetical protein|uniref:hypothetical protein n=1 Tax=Thalassospira sp. MBR-102 TaxID=3156466 RepID=UPI003398CB66
MDLIVLLTLRKTGSEFANCKNQPLGCFLSLGEALRTVARHISRKLRASLSREPTGASPIQGNQLKKPVRQKFVDEIARIIGKRLEQRGPGRPRKNIVAGSDGK